MDLHGAVFDGAQSRRKTAAPAEAFSNNDPHDGESACASLDLSETRSGAHSARELSLSGLSDVGAVAAGGRTARLWNKSRCERHLEGDNQREENSDGDGASSAWSSLSVDTSGGASDDHSDQARSDARESLSLSVSTESDAGAAERVLYSSVSDASEAEGQDDEDARSKVLLPDGPMEEAPPEPPVNHEAESAEASSLSGEMSSSSFEVQYVEDDDKETQSAREDDALWEAFDAALQHCGQVGAVDIESMDPSLVPSNDLLAPPLTEDDGYDGSASEAESVSSPDESSGADSITEQYFYAGTRPNLDREVALRNSKRDAIESLDSSPRARRLDSPVSSLLASSEPSASTPFGANQSVDSLSDVSNGAADERRWIENVPVLCPVTAPGDNVNRLVGGPPTWRENEFVEARTSHARRHRRRMWSESDESLALEGEDEDQRDSPWEEDLFNALPTRTPTKAMARVSYADLEIQESYVSYADLAGIVDAHVARRPGVLLDLGCGTSRVCEELVFHGYKRVFGVDKDLSVIAFQRQQAAAIQLPEYLQYLPMDSARSLLFPDGSCDCIVSKATLDTIAAREVRDMFPSELVETLKVTIRCLKPGGVLIAVVYQENLLDEDDESDIETRRTKEERVAARLMRPWWRWSEVKGFLHQHLSLIRQYALGRPRVADGVRSKPYKVLVWRRNESDRQRLQRLLGEIMEEKRQRQEYETRVWLWQAQHEREAQARTMIQEARQMILEDEWSRLERTFANEIGARKERQQRRDAFYAALLEAERQEMAWEDEAGACRRKLEQEMRVFVVDTVLRDLVIGKAMDFVLTKQAEAERKRQEDVALKASIEAKQAKELADSVAQAAATCAWVREEVVRVVSAALASIAGGDSVEIQRAPVSQLTGPRGQDEDSAKTTTVAATEVAAAAAVVSTTVASVTAPDPHSVLHEGKQASTDSATKVVVEKDTTSVIAAGARVDTRAAKAAVAATAAETVAWIVDADLAACQASGTRAPQTETAPAHIKQVEETEKASAGANVVTESAHSGEDGPQTLVSAEQQDGLRDLHADKTPVEGLTAAVKDSLAATEAPTGSLEPPVSMICQEEDVVTGGDREPALPG